MNNSYKSYETLVENRICSSLGGYNCISSTYSKQYFELANNSKKTLQKKLFNYKDSLKSNFYFSIEKSNSCHCQKNFIYEKIHNWMLTKNNEGVYEYDSTVDFHSTWVDYYKNIKNMILVFS